MFWTHQCGSAALESKEERAIIKSPEIFRPTPVEVRKKHRLHFGGEIFILHNRRKFKVQHERAVVQIDRTHDGEIIVREESLLVHEAGLVAPDLHPRLAELRVVSERG